MRVWKRVYFDSGAAKENRVVADARLHRKIFRFDVAYFPRLIADFSRHGNRCAGTCCDDFAALHSLAVYGCRRQVQPDLAALLAFFGENQHAVAYDDQSFIAFHTESSASQCHMAMRHNHSNSRLRQDNTPAGFPWLRSVL